MWFNYLEETFADLIGVLMMGAAFVYSQHVLIDHLTKDEIGLGRSDLTHPIPVVRGEMGIYTYQKLLGPASDRIDLGNLDERWNQLIRIPWNNRVGNDGKVRDPHTPAVWFLKDEGNESGKLDYDETIRVMKLVVDTLLDKKLTSLNCHSLRQLVVFAEDEELRQSSFERNVDWEDGVSARIHVASKRLYKHRRNLTT